jgi:hypothetical protein
MQEVGGSIPPGSTTPRPQGEDRLQWINVARSNNFPEQDCTSVMTDLKVAWQIATPGRSPHTAKFAPERLSGIARAATSSRYWRLKDI